MARKNSVKKNTSKSASTSTKSKVKKTTKATKVTPPSTVSKIIKDERTPKILGLSLLAVGVFLVASGISHLIFHAHDAVLLENAPDLSSSAVKDQYKNQLGKIGALAGNAFITKGLGLATFIPFFLIIISGAKILRKRIPISLGSWWAKGAFLTFWLAIALSVPFLKSVVLDDGTEGIQDTLNLSGGVGYGLSLFLSNAIGKLGIFNYCI